MSSNTQQQINSTISHLEMTKEQQDEEDKIIAKLVKKETREIMIITESHRPAEERMKLIQSKYLELYQQNKRMERESLKLLKRQDIEQKEKEALISELHKVTIQKQKIENLCRELQKDNKKIKEKCELIVESQKQEREELSTKFVSTISEIRSEITQVKTVVGIDSSPSSSSSTTTSDPASIAAIYDTTIKEKLLHFFSQWTAREKQFEAVIKTNEMEMRLLESRVESQKQLATQEAERVWSLRAQVASFLSTERDLRRQLQVYVDKFRQVEETLNKSNELFSTFRIEMEAMTNKTKRLETDNLNLKARLEAINNSMIQIAQERNKTRKIIDAARYGKEKLESLCRALQAERNELRKRLTVYEPPGFIPPASSNGAEAAKAPVTTPIPKQPQQELSAPAPTPPTPQGSSAPIDKKGKSKK
ncbi:myosin-like coiled-coil protein-domain-containing protein [Obelidium mucronatum]|nr:myosin-like coiled-coil protein-domain-containing protein [Obelidium mucronatum]